MHDDTADLHTFEAAGYGLVHPHTAEGWWWLLRRLGPEELARYEAEEAYNPCVSDAQLAELIAAAERDGLAVQQARDVNLRRN